MLSALRRGDRAYTCRFPESCSEVERVHRIAQMYQLVAEARFRETHLLPGHEATLGFVGGSHARYSRSLSQVAEVLVCLVPPYRHLLSRLPLSSQ